ncbi:MAG: hypothetical protein HON33_00370 [Flavobacteriaceae bacterium]|jgi:hypothetical protein|nr:hypothetical protein [Flavobacteriaceae bacterium]MDG1830420.1 hypothetical protein [Flavobacteriaceae bacterium]|tara:strand:- start:915 stop:1976 length:1062 start_codon:yes stop_codon:yes gene_type:complete
MNNKLISKKKPSFKINKVLDDYLASYRRKIVIPIFYEDLKRFSGSVSVYNNKEIDTLWVRVFYSDFERKEIDENLKKVYNLLHSDGNTDNTKFLSIDAIDYCTFGNSKPFRVKIRNILNDNFTYFYVKKADASRIYGLELEHILSPYNLNFLVFENTLIEEHITGIPGDEFFDEFLPKCNDSERSQIAKEFVKFNERCMIRLLGDMRAYNYVIIPTHDFDQVVYKIRAIDFDQQCYEGNLQIYRPQFFKENKRIMDIIKEKLQKSSVDQYKIEERSIIAKRILSSVSRSKKILKCMLSDNISNKKNIKLLSHQIYTLTHDKNFKKAVNMGQIMKASFDYILRNYENHEMLGID